MSRCLEAKVHGEFRELKEIHYGWMINIKEKLASVSGGKHGPNYTRPYINHLKEFELHQNFIKWSVPLKVINKRMT